MEYSIKSLLSPFIPLTGGFISFSSPFSNFDTILNPFISAHNQNQDLKKNF